MELQNFIEALSETLKAAPWTTVSGEVEIDGKKVEISLRYKFPMPHLSTGGDGIRLKRAAELASQELKSMDDDQD